MDTGAMRAVLCLGPTVGSYRGIALVSVYGRGRLISGITRERTGWRSPFGRPHTAQAWVGSPPGSLWRAQWVEPRSLLDEKSNCQTAQRALEDLRRRSVGPHPIRSHGCVPAPLSGFGCRPGIILGRSHFVLCPRPWLRPCGKGLWYRADYGSRACLRPDGPVPAIQPC